MNVFFHTFDLPDDFNASSIVAIDTEAMGLKNHRDRMCLVQISNGDGDCHLVHFPTKDFQKSPNLLKILKDHSIQKLFHYARFDVAILMHSFKIEMDNIYCTKIASRLTRTFTNRHGLKDICRDFLNVELSKQEQTSDWGRPDLSDEQKKYAATDVLYLHDLKKHLDVVLERENLVDVAAKCFAFLPTRARFDLESSEHFDIFSYRCD